MTQVKATVQNGNLMHAADMLCSISFDRDDEFFATAGVSRRIKVLPDTPIPRSLVAFRDTVFQHGFEARLAYTHRV